MAEHAIVAPARTPLDPGFAAALAQRFGTECSFAEAICRQHGQSETHFPETLPDAVVFARSTADVVDLVRLCVAHRVPVVPYGAGTSIEGNALPVRGGVSVDLSKMDRILAVNAEDFDCTVEAGVRREELNAYLRDTGLFFPIDPRRQCDDRRDGRDPREWDQCGALRHDARGGARAHRGDREWRGDPHRAPRAQIGRRL